MITHRPSVTRKALLSNNMRTMSTKVEKETNLLFFTILYCFIHALQNLLCKINNDSNCNNLPIALGYTDRKDGKQRIITTKKTIKFCVNFIHQGLGWKKIT